MRISIVFFILFSINIFSQESIYFFKDSLQQYNIENIDEAKFSLVKKSVLEKYSKSSYWFKVPAKKTLDKYIFRITYDRVFNANAYQHNLKIAQVPNHRYLAYSFNRDADFYLQVTPKVHSYIPVELEKEKNLLEKENKIYLFNGFYYGFAFLIILYNLLYFFVFRDKSFLYYALFLTSVCFGIFVMDGMLNLFNVNEKLNDILMILNYISLAYFSSKFADSYLQLNRYYPKLKRNSYIIGFFIVVLGFLYILNPNYYYMLWINILVFTLQFVYWITSILLFKKNLYVKLLTFAYAILIISAIDFFILKFLGISVIDINATTIKIGAFVEMSILSFAVLFRMNALKRENKQIKKDLVVYSKQFAAAKDHINTKELLGSLSLREREIFNLITKTNKEIAAELNISVNTVKFHVKNIYEKLNIKSRKEVITIKESQ